MSHHNGSDLDEQIVLSVMVMSLIAAIERLCCLPIKAIASRRYGTFVCVKIFSRFFYLDFNVWKSKKGGSNQPPNSIIVMDQKFLPILYFAAKHFWIEKSEMVEAHKTSDSNQG